MPIYHLTTTSDWSAALEQGLYSTPTLASEGFIHCSTAGQLLPVANAFYLEMDDPLVLVIDPANLAARLAWEFPEGTDPFTGERFPHIYGPINLDSVVRTVALEKAPDGRYLTFEPDSV